jgi:hypothetical protein
MPRVSFAASRGGNRHPPNRVRPGPWLVAARIGWTLLALAVLSLYVAALVNEVRRPPVSCAGPDTLEVECDVISFTAEDLALASAQGVPPWFVEAHGFVFDLLFNLAYIGVGLFLFWRRPDDPLALLLSLTLLLLGAFGFSAANEMARRLLPGFPWVVSLLESLTYALPVFLACIFPTGRFAPRWLGYLYVPLLVFAFTVPNLAVVPPWLVALSIGAVLGLAVYSQVYRYARVSSPLQRQQVKWVAFGFLATGFTLLGWVIANAVFPPFEPTLARVVFLLLGVPLLLGVGTIFPISVAIAILRYRLYDIDLILRRTLAYSLISAILLLTYYVVVVSLQFIVALVLGQQQTALVTVLTTLTIAALFFPLRRQVQTLIDRRFFRRRYDAAQTLTAFSVSARSETDLERLSDRLLAVVQDTMQPEWITLWLR